MHWGLGRGEAGAARLATSGCCFTWSASFRTWSSISCKCCHSNFSGSRAAEAVTEAAAAACIQKV